jgi:L-ascorbate metabolism protein UlaG (beta-lactamase superfamily)
MSYRLTWLGHSVWILETAGTSILIDPFLTGNPSATASAESLSPDFIAITHGHGDHVGDAVEIAKRTGATVVSNYEICEWLTAKGVAKTHAMNLGGGFAFPFGRLELTIAHHSSMLPDGAYGGNPAGLLFTLNDGAKIYHAADTALFLEMELLGKKGIDTAILPIGDNYTMGPDDALLAVEMLMPKRVIPTHFGTWPVIAQDAEEWARRVRNKTGVEVVVLAPGESWENA